MRSVAPIATVYTQESVKRVDLAPQSNKICKKVKYPCKCFRSNIHFSSCVTNRRVCTDFPGTLVVKTWRSQCRGHRFDPWLGN